MNDSIVQNEFLNQSLVENRKNRKEEEESLDNI